MARTAHFHLAGIPVRVTRPTQGVALLVAALLCLGSVAVFPMPVQIPLMLGSVIVLSVWVLQWRWHSARVLLLAALFALFITTQHVYVYDGFNLYVGIVNMYPLLLWTTSLVILKQLHDVLPKQERFWGAMLAYFVFLFGLEAFGYYVLGIRSVGGHPSLFGLGVIHGPPIIHWFYLTAGPVFLLIIRKLKW